MQEGGSENAAPEKPQAWTGATAVLGDATNTYCTGQQRPSSGFNKPSPVKQHTKEMRIPQGHQVPQPAADAAMSEFDLASTHKENPQHVAEYMQDIFRLLKTKESASQVSPGYMESQTHVNAKMRAILVDWLVDVGKKYKLRAETLFLSVQLIDRYLEINATQRRHLQLVGATALLIAAKFEEVYPPQIKEFEYITDKAYTRDELLKMEICILKALDFNICCPTAISFLDRYQSVNGCTDSHRFLAQYLLELSLVEYKMLKYGPSHLAAASLFLSNKLLRQTGWTSTMVQQTQMSECMLRDCAKDMCGLLEHVETNSLQAVRRKFSHANYHAVAKLNFSSGNQTALVSARRSSVGGA
jgi:cyclin B